MARLLVVEDQSALLKSLRRGFEEESHTVFTAIGGTEAYLLATREPLDAIIMDLGLPDGDGLSAMK